MRTILTVEEATTVTIEPTSKEDHDAVLLPYRQGSSPRAALGTYPLERGLYIALSACPLAVRGAHASAITITGKDEFPDPPHNLSQLEPGATMEAFRAFIQIDKGIEPLQ